MRSSRLNEGRGDRDEGQVVGTRDRTSWKRVMKARKMKKMNSWLQDRWGGNSDPISIHQSNFT